MRDPHSFANRTFVIGGLILFATGLLLIARRHNLFTPTFEVYAEFDRLNGLQQGAKVRVSGMAAGEVLEAQVPNQPDGRFRLKLRLRQEFHALVRGDSIATIKTTGLAGSSFLDIQKGTQRSPELSSGSTIPSKEPFDLGDLIQRGGDVLQLVQTTLPALHASAERTLASINLAARHTDRTVLAMAPELQMLASSARQTSDDVGEIIAQVGQGQGTIGKLLKDPALADLVDQTVKNAHHSAINLNNASAQLNATLAEFQRRQLLGHAEAVLKNSRQLTEALNQVVAKVTNSALANGNTAADLRDAIANAQISMANLAENTEAFKHNFLVHEFFKKRGYFNLDRMSLAKYRKLLKERFYQRVWLTKNDLFSAGPNGKETLTKYGEARIDAAMSAQTPYLPNSPIVVEGYATQGSPSERFIRARQRAVAVQIYIRKRFGLPSNNVGVMPLPDSVSSALGKPGWDGVAIVLLR